jgi:hypothetical protein
MGAIPASSAYMGRNTNAFVANTVDQEPYLYWDTLITASGTQLSGVYNAFSIPIGTPNPFNANAPNTKLQTNMQKANEFPPPRCLLLNSICFQYSSQMIKADIDKVEDGCYIEFKIADKTFFEGYLRDMPAGAGLMGVTTNNGESVYTNGWPTPAGRRTFGSWAKYIPPLTRFTVNLFFNGSNTSNVIPTLTGPVGLYMRVVLDGITALPVQ